MRVTRWASTTAVVAAVLGTVGGALAAAYGSSPPSVRAAAAGLPATGDTRVVVQPHIPTVCAKLPAQLAANNRRFSAAAEAQPPDTGRVQAALNRCAGSGGGTAAVELQANGNDTAFLTGPLSLKGGVVLVVDAGVTLFGSLNPASYQVSGSSSRCGTISSGGGGCAPLISVSGAHSGVMGTRNATGSQGIIDGRGDLPMYGSHTTWYALATAAKSGGKQNNPRLVQANHANDFTLYDIDLVNSANFHVSYQNGDGFTAWGVRIKTPADARNTDGIDPAGATDVTVNDSSIQDGDDGIAIKGATPSRNITIENSHFYGTHGISIGSETNGGVTNVLFRNDTLDGVDSSGIPSTSSNGIRIKSDVSRGGRVSQIAYTGICLTRVRNPLVFDPRYDSGARGSLIPSFTGIVLNGVRAENSPSKALSTLDGYSAAYPLGITLANVQLDAPASTASYARITLSNTNLAPSGPGVTVTRTSVPGTVPSCSFPSYPAL